MNPIRSPATRLIVIVSPLRKIAAITITNSGTAPLITAARDESIVCSANVIRLNGIAMLIDAHDEQVAVHPRVARQRLAGQGHDRREEDEPDQEPEHDQRERLQAVVDADLDEQVVAAPEEAEGEEDQPVEPGAAGCHGTHDRRLLGLAQWANDDGAPVSSPRNTGHRRRRCRTAAPVHPIIAPDPAGSRHDCRSAWGGRSRHRTRRRDAALGGRFAATTTSWWPPSGARSTSTRRWPSTTSTARSPMSAASAGPGS